MGSFAAPRPTFGLTLPPIRDRWPAAVLGLGILLFSANNLGQGGSGGSGDGAGEGSGGCGGGAGAGALVAAGAGTAGVRALSHCDDAAKVGRLGGEAGGLGGLGRVGSELGGAGALGRVGSELDGLVIAGRSVEGGLPAQAFEGLSVKLPGIAGVEAPLGTVSFLDDAARVAGGGADEGWAMASRLVGEDFVAKGGDLSKFPDLLARHPELGAVAQDPKALAALLARDEALAQDVGLQLYLDAPDAWKALGGDDLIALSAVRSPDLTAGLEAAARADIARLVADGAGSAEDLVAVADGTRMVVDVAGETAQIVYQTTDWTFTQKLAKKVGEKGVEYTIRGELQREPRSEAAKFDLKAALAQVREKVGPFAWKGQAGWAEVLGCYALVVAPEGAQAPSRVLACPGKTVWSANKAAIKDWIRDLDADVVAGKAGPDQVMRQVLFFGEGTFGSIGPDQVPWAATLRTEGETEVASYVVAHPGPPSGRWEARLHRTGAFSWARYELRGLAVDFDSGGVGVPAPEAPAPAPEPGPN